MAVALPFSTLADQAARQPADADETVITDKALSEGLAKLVAEPTKENYLAVRKLVVSHSKYDPYSRDLDEIERLSTDPKNENLRKRAKAAAPNLLLSPKYHRILKIAALWRGEEATLVAERRMAAACLKGILATGDGTAEKPYLVVRISDEYDVLAFLGKRSESQALSFQGDRKLDIHQCSDASTVWFDVTDVFAHVTRRKRAGPEAK
jgi:hypothetical protein